ncbi:hypothetical protein [Streptomyces sp. NPDC048295]|uniref:hypothetical protein n=1 Tax=Streptomyces sp. NPDC048295 TaxID=3154617 RepID=UPI00341A316F
MAGQVADRPIVAGALFAAATATFVVIAEVLHSHRRAQRETRRQVTEPVDESWFTSGALDSFPMDAVRLLLLAPGVPACVGSVPRGSSPPTGTMLPGWHTISIC